MESVGRRVEWVWLRAGGVRSFDGDYGFGSDVVWHVDGILGCELKERERIRAVKDFEAIR